MSVDSQTNRSLQDELEHHKTRSHTHLTERTEHLEQINRLRMEIERLSDYQSEAARTANRANNLEMEADQLDYAVQQRDDEIDKLKANIDSLVREHDIILEDTTSGFDRDRQQLLREIERLEMEIRDRAEQAESAANGLEDVSTLLV